MHVAVQARLAKLLAFALAATVAGCATLGSPLLPITDGPNSSSQSAVNAGNHVRTGHLNLAESLYAQTMSINSKSLEEWLELGAIQTVRGEFVAATQSYRAAQALDPSSLEAAFALGQLAVAEGRPADAVEDIKAALGAQPDDPQLNYLAWTAYTRLGQFEIARGYYRSALTPPRQRARSNDLPAVKVEDIELKAEASQSEAPLGLRVQTDGLTISTSP